MDKALSDLEKDRIRLKQLKDIIAILGPDAKPKKTTKSGASSLSGPAGIKDKSTAKGKAATVSKAKTAEADKAKTADVDASGEVREETVTETEDVQEAEAPAEAVKDVQEAAEEAEAVEAPEEASEAKEAEAPAEAVEAVEETVEAAEEAEAVEAPEEASEAKEAEAPAEAVEAVEETAESNDAQEDVEAVEAVEETAESNDAQEDVEAVEAENVQESVESETPVADTSENVQEEAVEASKDIREATKEAEAKEAPEDAPEAKEAEAPVEASKDIQEAEVSESKDIREAKDGGGVPAASEQKARRSKESPVPKRAEPPAIRMVQKPAENAASLKISAKEAPMIKPAAIKAADAPQAMQEPKKIPVKKPVPKKTAAKTSTGKKAKKTSLIKSAKTPKKRKAAEVPNTLEDELAIQLTPEEIDSFQIEKVDMEKLTHKVCDILLRCESEGMLQADLYKKLKLSARNGARLSLKLERMGMVNRIKLLADERWTYKLVLKKTPVSTVSLENAPCLICPVEQKCSVDGDISPRTCDLIEEWVTVDLKRRS